MGTNPFHLATKARRRLLLHWWLSTRGSNDVLPSVIKRGSSIWSPFFFDSFFTQLFLPIAFPLLLHSSNERNGESSICSRLSMLFTEAKTSILPRETLSCMCLWCLCRLKIERNHLRCRFASRFAWGLISQSDFSYRLTLNSRVGCKFAAKSSQNPAFV